MPITQDALTLRPALGTWLLRPIAHRGAVMPDLDNRAECSDGREGIITLMRWPVGWRIPLHLTIPRQMGRRLLAIAREVVST